jgi:transposase-like protein
MTINNQPKAVMDAVNFHLDPAPSQGARRATGDGAGSAPPLRSTDIDMEVVPRAKRRRFSNADKRRILKEADGCNQPGQIGALLRREGVYSSSLSNWRSQREANELAGLAPQKRGPKADPKRADALHIAKLTLEKEKLQIRLDKAMLVIDVQKKVAALLGHTLDKNGEII